MFIQPVANGYNAGDAVAPVHATRLHLAQRRVTCVSDVDGDDARQYKDAELDCGKFV